MHSGTLQPGARGTLVTFTVIRKPPAAFALEPLYAVAIVDVDPSGRAGRRRVIGRIEPFKPAPPPGPPATLSPPPAGPPPARSPAARRVGPRLLPGFFTVPRLNSRCAGRGQASGSGGAAAQRESASNVHPRRGPPHRAAPRAQPAPGHSSDDRGR